MHLLFAEIVVYNDDGYWNQLCYRIHYTIILFISSSLELFLIMTSGYWDQTCCRIRCLAILTRRSVAHRRRPTVRTSDFRSLLQEAHERILYTISASVCQGISSTMGQRYDYLRDISPLTLLELLCYYLTNNALQLRSNSNSLSLENLIV